MAQLGARLKKAWNAFRDRDPTKESISYFGGSYSTFGNSSSPYYSPLKPVNSKTIVSTVINRIAVDCSAIDIKHVRLDDDGNYDSTIDDNLNDVLTCSANADQTGRSMIQDLIESLLDEGIVAIFPFDADLDPESSGTYEIYGVRVAKILEWFPQHIRIEVYNELTGQKVEMVVQKRICPIIQNPFYTVMNEPNSTRQRLKSVLAQLEKCNKEVSSGKIDMIVKLPYMIKNKAKQDQAKEKIKDIEDQLSNGGPYGIAYIDATDQVIQLNRSIDNNLWEQAQSLTDELFQQMGITRSILDGSANETTMLNYYNQTISPILTAIVEEMERKWLTPTARTQKQAIRFFRDPFKLVSVKELANIANAFTGNAILSANEVRGIMGFKPSNDRNADKLVNPSIKTTGNENQTSNDVEEIQNDGEK